MAKRKKKPAPEVKGDPRVLALADCVLFAINNFPNKPVFGANGMTSWHAWFKQAMENAGYTLTEPAKETT